MTERPGGNGGSAAFENKLLGILLALFAGYLLFRLAVGGIFGLMMGAAGAGGIYVLFYGGLVVLAVMAGLGLAALALFVRRQKAAGAKPPGALGRGLTLGLAVIVAAVVLYLSLFVWMHYALGG